VCIALWSFVLTFVILWLLDKIPFLRVRVSEEEEEKGIDAAMGESAYHFAEGVQHRSGLPSPHTDHAAIPLGQVVVTSAPADAHETVHADAAASLPTQA
jgi:hypothetical protein